jgi:hypothetical protein
MRRGRGPTGAAQGGVAGGVKRTRRGKGRAGEFDPNSTVDGPSPDDAGSRRHRGDGRQLRDNPPAHETMIYAAVAAAAAGEEPLRVVRVAWRGE